MPALAALVYLLPLYSPGDLAHKLRDRLGDRHPAFAQVLDGVIRASGLKTSQDSMKSARLPEFPGPGAWPAQGVLPQGFMRQQYDQKGIPVPSPPGPFVADMEAEVVRVGDMASLRKSLGSAKPGQVITLAPGVYRFKGHNLAPRGAGLPEKPIVVRAESPGQVSIELDTLEGFLLTEPYWVFENLAIRGVCARDSDCEHAFHVIGKAVGTVLRNNELLDFNAPLKVNGRFTKSGSAFPDHGLVQNNSVYNTGVRETDGPVTMLNINAANGWLVRGNFIADFAKGGSNRVSYGAFMKSGSRNGVFERNLVVCHWRLQPRGGVRIGLSFGGGGTDARYTREGSNRFEHRGGVMRNNVIVRCPADVGIYLNKAADTRVYNNAVIGGKGVDVRFSTSTALVEDNLLDGRVQARDGGSYQPANNLLEDDCGLLQSWFGDCGSAAWYAQALTGDLRLLAVDEVLNRGKPAQRGETDFCGNPRSGSKDLGPIEYGAGPLCLPTFESN